MSVATRLEGDNPHVSLGDAALSAAILVLRAYIHV